MVVPKFKGWMVSMETKHVFSIVLLRYKSRWGDIVIEANGFWTKYWK